MDTHQMNPAETPIVIAFVTDNRWRLARVDTLTKGSHVRLLGAAPLTDEGIEAIAKHKPDIVLVDAFVGEAKYLAFCKKLLAKNSHLTCALFGSSESPSVFARAAVHGIREYLPDHLQYSEFLAALSEIAKGSSPSPASAFRSIADSISRPDRHATLEGSVDNPLSIREIATRCTDLGLSTEETATYLDLSEDEVRRWTTSKDSWLSGIPNLVGHRGLYTAAIGCCLLIAFSMWQSTKPHVPQTQPVQGRVVYDDGNVLPVGPLELTCFAVSDDGVAPKSLGRAVVDAPTGAIRNMIYASRYAGLPRGEYKVTVCLPGQVALPAFIAAEEYGDVTRTPLTLTVGDGPFLAAIKKPQELLARFDANDNGLLEPAEKVAVTKAVTVASQEGGNDEDLENPEDPGSPANGT